MKNSRIARRIVGGFLRFKYCYKVDFSHKPLCGRFKKEVIRPGGIHLCRSCILLYLGLFLGGTGLVIFHEKAVPLFFPLFFGLLPSVLLSYPPLYARMVRPVRDLLRFGAGIFLALLLLSFHFVHLLFFGAFLLSSLLSYLFYSKVRKSRARTICRGCSHLEEKGICPGFRLKASCIKEYEKAYEEYLYKSGAAFPGPKGFN